MKTEWRTPSLTVYNDITSNYFFLSASSTKARAYCNTSEVEVEAEAEEESKIALRSMRFETPIEKSLLCKSLQFLFHCYFNF